MKNKSLFWAEISVLGSYIIVEALRAKLKIRNLEWIIAHYARLFGCAVHDFRGFMGNEDVPRPRKEIARYARLFECATHDFNGFMGNEGVTRPRIDNGSLALVSLVMSGNIVLL